LLQNKKFADKKRLKKKHSLKEVYDLHWEGYVNSVSRKLYLEDHHFCAVNKCRTCRSDKLGQTVLLCLDCGELSLIDYSCKHRFCCTCGAADTLKWAEKLKVHLLKMSHHHITFTLPKSYRWISKKNGVLLYNLLFETSAIVIQSWFKESHNLRPGIVSVLHTSGSDLKYHPHVHQIVSRGGQDILSGEYRKLEGGNYLVKNEILGLRFKREFNKRLLKIYEKGELELGRRIRSEECFKKWLLQQKDKHWIVNIEAAVDEVLEVVKYIGRYTKRACLSEYKLEYVGEEEVRFRYNDYKNSKRGEKPLTAIRRLTPYEFLDELLQHVPKKRYRMVRYCGLYNSYYHKKIPSDWLLSKEEKEDIDWAEDYDWSEYEQYRKAVISEGKADPFLCLHCNKIKRVIGVQKKGLIEYFDSS